MTFQTHKLNIFQFIKYLFSPFDSRESTLWSINEVFDVKYGTLKAFFWVFIVVIALILVNFK